MLHIFVSTMEKPADIDPDSMLCAGHDVSFICQCGEDGVVKTGPYTAYCYNERGLARSRNRALENARDGYLWLSDNDLRFDPDCEAIIEEEFAKAPEADALLFDVTSLTADRPNRPLGDRHAVVISNAMRYPTFQYVFKAESLKRAGVRFNENFGSGAMFASGEDSIFTADCLRKGLKIMAVPREIAVVDHKESAWFKGFDEKYRRDKGALLYAIFGRRYLFYCAVMLVRHRQWRGNKSFIGALTDMKKGMKAYRKALA